MKATVFEFRFRFWIIMAIYILGFVAPWNFVLHLDGAGPNGAPGQLAGWGGNAHVWGLLAVLLLKGGAMSIAAAFNLLLAVAIRFEAIWPKGRPTSAGIRFRIFSAMGVKRRIRKSLSRIAMGMLTPTSRLL